MKSAKGQLDLISEFSKVPGYKISIYKSAAFLYISSNQHKWKKDIYNFVRNCEILNDISDKVVRDLYTVKKKKKKKHCWETLEKALTKWRECCVHELENLILLKWQFSQDLLYIYIVPVKITAGFWREIDRLVLKFIQKWRGPRILKQLRKIKNKIGGAVLPKF